MEVQFRIIKFVLFILLSSLLAGCWNSYQIKTISDVTKKQSTMLVTARKGEVYSITIIGKGYIDGTAVISSPNTPIYEKLSGKVNFKVESDCYDHALKIDYLPTSVKSGKLQLQFQFHTL